MKASVFEIQMLLRRTGHGANCFRSGELTRVRLLACQSGLRYQALVLPSGKVSFDAERNAKGPADKLWAVALACQKEREAVKARTGEIGVRVLG